MDGYDTKTLEQLRQIALEKYKLEIPIEMQLGEAIEWLRLQDAIAATRIEAVLQNKPILISPKSPKVAAMLPVGQTAPVFTQPVLPTTIPTLPGIEDLPKGTDIPTIPVLTQETQTTAIIKPTVPTMATVPTIPTIPMIPTLGTAFPMAQMKYYLNDENTLRTLHGPPALPWDTNLETINDVRDQKDVQPINPNAVFQKKTLHPNYRTPTARGPVSPRFPVVPILTIPVAKLPTTEIPKVPTTPKEPIKIVATPKEIPQMEPPKIMTPPKSPVKVVIAPKSPVKQATLPVAPTITQPVVTLAQPVVTQPTVPKFTLPVVPTVTQPVVPTVTQPILPKVPQPFVPTVPQPTVPKVTQPFVPTVPQPTVPKVPQPFVPTMIQPTVTQPVVPKPTLLLVTKPVVPQPTIPQPTIPQPTIPQPTIPQPTIPQPTFLRPMTLVPQVPATTVFPVQGGMVILTVGQTQPKPAPTPFGPLTPKAPIMPTEPTTPGFITGPQVGGLTTIRATTLTPTIPNVLMGTNAPPPFINPPVTGTQGIPTIKMPTFNTAVAPINTPVKRPSPTQIQQTQTLRTTPLPGTAENTIAVLNEIDPELLVGERTGKNKKGYSLTQLQGFAQRLGLTVSGKRKQELIDDIQKVRREMGLI